MNRWTWLVALAAALGVGATAARAQSFTYHGSLQDAGKAADGRYDMQLTLYSQRDGGTIVAGPLTLFGVVVTEGRFVTQVDFGTLPHALAQGWVDVKVKAAADTAFTSLDARSPVTPDGGCPGSWALDGNVGTSSSSFLGTLDAMPVWIEANNTPNAVFRPNGAVGLAHPDGENGAYSVAIGFHAKTNNAGSTMVGGYQDGGLSQAIGGDSAPNQFIVGAAGGMGINTAHAPDGNALRDELTIAPSAVLPGTNADLTLETSTTDGYSGFHFEAAPNGFLTLHGLYTASGVLDYDNLLRVNYSHNIGGYFAFNGSTYTGPITVGNAGGGFGNGAYVSTGGVWTNASSRSFKEGFAAVDAVAVLDKLVALPLQTWVYKASHEEGQHMGPFAEDFARTFGLGNDEQHIATVDESGVAFAAIQGLNRKVERENAALRTQNAELRERLERIAARLDALDARGEK